MFRRREIARRNNLPILLAAMVDVSCGSGGESLLCANLGFNRSKALNVQHLQLFEGRDGH